MEITIKENKTSEIDFSVAGQWLITNTIDGENEKVLVQTTGRHTEDCFEGVIMVSESYYLKPLEKYATLGKEYSKVFKGTLTFGEIVEETPQLPLKLNRGALYEELEAKIAEVNEGWIPNFDDRDEKKWYPYFELSNNNVTLGSVCYSCYDSDVPPSLIFKSEEICRKFVEENIELYEKLYKP